MLIRQTPITSFKSSRFNIAGISDTHGNVSTLPYLVKNIEEHKDEIFIKEGTVVNENNKKTALYFEADEKAYRILHYYNASIK